MKPFLLTLLDLLGALALVAFFATLTLVVAPPGP